MKKFLTLIFGLIIVSCNQNQTNHGVMQNDDDKSLIVKKLADSYLAGNFDMAREYFSEDGKHYFNDLEFDVDGIIEGYNSHSLIFNDIKHNDRKIYTGYFSDGSVMLMVMVQVVSQFTLYALTKKGNRPSYIHAAKGEFAEINYNLFVDEINMIFNKKIKTGKFGADMQIDFENDGPVTIIIDSKNKV